MLLPCRKMSNPYEYHPELGLYYHEVAPGLLCGTQLRSTADVERLAGLQPARTMRLMQRLTDNLHDAATR